MRHKKNSYGRLTIWQNRLIIIQDIYSVDFLPFILIFVRFEVKNKDMEKSRKISLEQFVINLQLEYLSCKLRSIVYNRIESVELVKIYKDIAEKKKTKILNLKQRFRLGTMFDSDKAFSDFYLKEFLQEYGLPNLQYSEKTKKSVMFWDRFHLLKPGTIVIYKGKEYKVKINHPNDDNVVIWVNDVPEQIPYTYFKMRWLEKIDMKDLK